MSNAQQPYQNFALFTAPDGAVKLNVVLEDETLWLSQKMMAELFEVDARTVSEHLQNIYQSAELSEKATIRNFRLVQKEGTREVSREVSAYNLDAIIAVGYRVNSRRATQFRVWATGVLKEFIIKGFALDDERLKQGGRAFGRDYFRDLLERVRSIRTSERRIYLQLTDIFAECSTDYDPQSEAAREFFATVQNRFHFAITGHTAAEIIHDRADRAKDHMGMTTWKGSPAGRILATDVVIAKNYLPLEEISDLERTVAGFFDYIEGLVRKQRTFTMAEFAESVNKFLSFNEYRVLDGAGSVTMDAAKQKALGEYEEFNKTQKIDSDFEKALRLMDSRDSALAPPEDDSMHL